ncbi:MAG: hypothetical protein ACI8PQ_002878 [Planctomycetota bacterium]
MAGLRRLALIEEAGARPLDSFSDEVQAKLVEAGISDELVLWNAETQGTLLGAAGILRKLRGSWAGPLAVLLSAPGLRFITTVIYRFIASNRRYLSVPEPQPIRCACDPKARPPHQEVLMTLCTGLGLLGSASLGAMVGVSSIGWKRAAGGALLLHIALIVSVLFQNRTKLPETSPDRRPLFIHSVIATTAAAIPLLLLTLLPSNPWFASSSANQDTRVLFALACGALTVYFARRSLAKRRAYLGLAY